MVAINKNNALYYIHDDLIDTPRAIMNNAVVWTLDITDAQVDFAEIIYYGN